MKTSLKNLLVRKPAAQVGPLRTKRTYLTLLFALAALASLIAATATQAQVVAKYKPLPAGVAVKPRENALPSFPLGPAGNLQREIVALTNKARQEAGLKPLRVNRVLTTVAQGHALNMAREDKMSHE